MTVNDSDAILARLMKLHPKKIDLSLDRLYKLLEKLGNPHKKLPPVIHIAGTNGKGSTVSTLRAIAEAAGHRVHVYTSPHLVRFNERIRVAGSLIDDETLSDILAECERANGNDPITFFEVTTAAAFLAFSRVDADLCILEVGLGGRLDATNVIENPAATCITPVSFDHEQFLGDTIEAISGEKAGIIKKGAPVIVGPQLAAAKKVISSKIAEESATGYFFKDDWNVELTNDSDYFLYSDQNTKLTLPKPNLIGIHQVSNAGLAIKIAMTQQAVHIPEAAIRAGLGWVRWPARLQKLDNTPLNNLLPDNSLLWLDGGHNPAAAGVIRTFLQTVDPTEQPIFLILGMMGTKDVEGYLKPLANLLTKVIAVPIEGEDGAAKAADLAAAATDLGLNGVIAKDFEAALSMIDLQSSRTAPPFVLIGGSLYLAGQVLKRANILPD
ncbi:folylpolyglutamate synthase/dihydrofolate synthase family protein [Kordiimonas sp. SCSIO 12610]|uniref:bifunctional folylpolyglutamate synthase/dihydrofolate synthase n=1 Tax=Kordiimonas sp. SCSIO 12610 TaxID=2829597 RepID=UPI00210C9817|nr:folylpolyglutamate synthase/dihydrofolate synthase family protein [Kordiimonas sp. SCSIO 12610]UTW55220.1 bifunctional folylpolyglutamate synthase/dihydrofolate synthase [Kordiimonas sp. SCSIO 12610]